MQSTKPSIIHEPLVPRTFRLLAEFEKEGNGVITYGLENPDDNTFTNWNGSIMANDRFYELKLVCGEDYPMKPPKIRFVSKIIINFVNQSNGEVIPDKLPHLKNWTKNNTIESLLQAIEKEMETSAFKSSKQPAEGTKF